jgi:predicted RNA-binding Zn-ribbon protein involved in translation (DUF1610 family)
MQPVPQQYGTQYNLQYQPQMNPYYIGHSSQILTCRQCGATGPSFVVHESGFGTWLLCLGATCLTGICGPLVFLFDSTHDSIHYCTSCGSVVGVKKLIN